jgi:hypothetical protein
MILNNKQNAFTIYFPPNFFSANVERKWTPVINRLKLPYESLEDFFNSSIQSVTLPQISLPTVQQQQSQFPINYRGGKELEPTLDKTIDVSFKLSEGFITYWILFDQIEEYLLYKEDDVFWPSMFVSFLDLNGIELVVFEFEKIVPTSLSTVELSYASTAADFNTFNLGLRYNRFNIKRRVESTIYTQRENH